MFLKMNCKITIHFVASLEHPVNPFPFDENHEQSHQRQIKLNEVIINRHQLYRYNLSQLKLVNCLTLPKSFAKSRRLSTSLSSKASKSSKSWLLK